MLPLKIQKFIETKKHGIHLDEGEKTTKFVQLKIETSIRILLIVDDGYTDSYSKIRDLSKLTIYEIIKTNSLTDKVVLQLSKFIILAQFGYIKSTDYGIIIFRLNQVKKELANIFKNFYYGNKELKSASKPNVKIIAYLKEITENDSLFLCTRNYTDNQQYFMETNPKIGIKTCKQPILDKSTFKMLVVEPAYVPAIEKYVPAKISLTKHCNQPGDEISQKLLEKVERLENTSFQLAFMKIRSKFDISDIKPQDFKKMINFEEVKRMLITEMKFKKINEMHKELECKIFLVCENKDIFKYLKSDKLVDTLCCEQTKIEEYANSSILLFYDYYHLEFANYHFSEVLIFHVVDEPFDNFLKLRTYRTENQEQFKFLNLLKENEPSFTIEGSSTIITRSQAFVLLINFLQLVKAFYDEHYLYIKDMGIQPVYDETDGLFICYLKLPYLHDDPLFSNTHKSDPFANKKLAKQDISLKIFRKLYSKGFVDENGFPTNKFISNNNVYDSYLEKVYNTHDINEIAKMKKKFINEKLLNTILNSQAIENNFRKAFPMFLNSREEIKVDNSELCQAVFPHNLTKFQKKSSVYVFNENQENDWDIGICCSELFEENISVGDTNIKFLGNYEFSTKELDLIVFFQTIFFALHFKKTNSNIENERPFCYFMVPIKNGTIDFAFLRDFSNGFLKSNVYEQKNNDFQKYLLFNPVTKIFFTYKEEVNFNIMEKRVPVNGNKYFTSTVPERHISHADFFEEKYGVELLHKENDPKLIFKGGVYSNKGETSLDSILSAEILHTTTIQKNLFQKFQLFLKYFFTFEFVSLAADLKKRANLDISILNIAISLNCKKEDKFIALEDNYERYEFFGDSILKYIVSKHLYLCADSKLGNIVSGKDDIVSNENLIKIAEKLDIPSFFSSICYSEKLFQPPNLFALISELPSICAVRDIESLQLNFANYIEYLKAEKTFTNSNRSSFIRNLENKINENGVRGKKVYADIVEAIIGMYYIENGFESAKKFIYDIGIISQKNETEYEENLQYSGILTQEEIEIVETKLKYVFKNKALLERAMVHPSSQPAGFSSECFQNIEFLGDSILDFGVTKHIFFKYTDFDPFKLHECRKSLVNNFSLARILFDTDLIRYCKICFDDSYLENVKHRLVNDGGVVNKLFGDIFEAICGAVLIDSRFEVPRFIKFLDQFIPILEKCADTTR